MIYSIFEEKTKIDNVSYNTYGIRATKNEEPIDEFHDVSLDKRFAENIVEKLNSCKIELCHFHDVVIDELNR